MNKSLALRRMLLAPPTIRTSLLFLAPKAIHPSLPRPYSTLPSVIQPSFWRGLIPKPFRKSSPGSALKKKEKSKEWNSATFFIWIFLFIGSMSIQMISLRNEFTAFSRRADAKITLLKEIIGRIQNGEEVDVEGLLGTGDAQREKEWEEVLQEIEQEDQVWEESRKSKPKHGRNLEEANAPTKAVESTEAHSQSGEVKPKTKRPAGFY